MLQGYGGLEEGLAAASFALPVSGAAAPLPLYRSKKHTAIPNTAKKTTCMPLERDCFGMINSFTEYKVERSRIILSDGTCREASATCVSYRCFL
jgi:hypothetical protein